jgi:hypothetical protein
MLSDNLKPFIAPIITTVDSQFPRACGKCRSRYKDFKQFVRETDSIGTPTLTIYPGDDEHEMVCWTNCVCSSTLVLSYAPRNKHVHDSFIQALESESQGNWRMIKKLLRNVCAEVRRRILCED